MQDITPKLRDLHNSYLKSTGLKPHLFPWSTHKMFFWERFAAKGWGVPELELVIRNIQREIRIGRRNRGALKFQNLIENLEAFESDLALYASEEERKKAKPPTNSGKAKVLGATWREKNADELRCLKTFKQVLESEEFKAFSDLGRKLAIELRGAKPEAKPADPGAHFE